MTLELKEVILEQLDGVYDEAQSSVRGVVEQNLLPIGCAVVSCVVLPLAALNAAAFDPGDLELAIAGLDDVDVGDWRAHTEYSQGYDDDDPAVANFWSFVAGLPDEKRAKLLQFVTGTSRLPAGGFANLQGRDGVTKGFELRRRPGGDKAFPVAHTCFNRLDLPAYSDVAVLARILSAILEGDVLGFSGD